MFSAETTNKSRDLRLVTHADWAGSPSDRRFTSGYCVLIRGNIDLVEKQEAKHSD